jgi:sugar O-acyltransferase (sialic acid O-acetyltransferase NeuD family)
MKFSKSKKAPEISREIEDDYPVIILGAGGHSKVLIEMLKRNGTEIIGIVDPAFRKNTYINDVPVIGDDSCVENHPADKIRLINGVGSIPGQNKRISIANTFRIKGYRFARVVDLNSCVASDAKLSEGVQIMPGVVIQPGVSIGPDTIVNTGVNIDHDCKIGSNVHIAPGATLCGNVIVHDEVHIGSGTTVIQSVEIGKNCIIGAGSLVLVDVTTRQKLIQKRVDYFSSI